MRPHVPHIAVIGAGLCDEATAAAAEAVGRELAGRGAVLVCGGLGGVMEAACRGAIEAGGQTIGILPGERRSEGNAYLSATVATGLGQARNLAVVATADAVIAVGGEYGTLSEIGLARKLGRTVIGLGSWQVSNGSAGTHVVPVDDATQAVSLALRAAARL